VLSRDAIRRHLTSELVFDGGRLPGYSDTIEHPDGLVLVDTGMIDTTPAIEDDGEEWHPHPLPDELVSRVAVVVNTHLHFDHCGGNRLFPGIPIHVQQRELADARTEDDYTVREWVDFPGATYVEHDGEAEILPGVRLVPAPGHTAGHQIVLVETDEGPIVLGGDVGHWFEELEGGEAPASSSSSNSRRRPTSRMSRRCVSRTRGRSVQSRRMGQRSRMTPERVSASDLLGQSDENALRASDVAEPIHVFVPDYFVDELRAVPAEPGQRIVEVVHREHDAEVAEGVDRSVSVIGDRRRCEKARELDPAVAVRRTHHGDLDALVA
jgi:N-acyl homoserine lactone hydrolase